MTASALDLCNGHDYCSLMLVHRFLLQQDFVHIVAVLMAVFKISAVSFA